MKAGDLVILEIIPPGLLDGLPEEDQAAILEIVGQPLAFHGYCDAWARLELNFIDKAGDQHTIWVEECFIKEYQEMKLGDSVILEHIPPDLLAQLPKEKQTTVLSMIGQSVKIVGVTRGQAELEFANKDDEFTIWIDTRFVKPTNVDRVAIVINLTDTVDVVAKDEKVPD